MRQEAEGAERLQQAAAAVAAGDGEAAIEHLSHAVRSFGAAGESRQAALACAHLGDVFANYLGNHTAAAAWFQRARRLLEDEPPCLEQGWVAVAAMGCDVADPDVLLENAEIALDRARRFGDVNLETKALADAGLAHVQAGRLVEGMALLDEAMALVCGPTDDELTAGKSVCSFFTACYFACDFARAGTWVPTLRRRGLIGQAPGAPAFVASHCAAVQAMLLCELGQWSEAESVLTRAIEDYRRAVGGPSWHPEITLAELRIRQERFTEAEQLLIGKAGHVEALLPAARLHAARGDLDLARATAERGLRSLRGDRLRAATLLALLVEIELAAGDLETAAQRCAQLDERAAAIEVPALRARIASTTARLRAALGDVDGAVAIVEAALDDLPRGELPFLAATLVVDLARLHDLAGRTAAATVEGHRAVAALEALDVMLPASDTALLARLAEGTPRAMPAGRTASLARDGTGWVVADGNVRGRLPGSKGLAYLAELVAKPGRERHALDLVDRVEGVSDAGIDRRNLGDAGELLDGRARAEYRRRIESLRAQIDDALERGADTTAQQLQEEVDQLVSQLSRAFGIGGRARHAGSAAERARLNVTRAVRTAVARVREVLPDAGDALARAVRTGLYCAYEPAEDEQIRWTVQSRVNDAHVD